jgi:uncharacterized repeat protein (TIGR01451 family)
MDGTTTVTVTVTNRGPSTAAKVMSGLILPRGFTVANAGGGEVQGSAVFFSAAALHSGKTLTYRVGVISHVKGRAVLGASALSGTRDPIYRNNSIKTATKTT